MSISRAVGALIAPLMAVALLVPTGSAAAATPAQPRAVNTQAPPERPLPASALPNHGLPAGERPPVEPPSVEAAGPAQAPDATAQAAPTVDPRWLGLASSELARPVLPRVVVAADDGGAGDGAPGEAPVLADVVAAKRLVLRPGFAMGDTSLVVYFDVEDREFATWRGSVTDTATGAVQESVELTAADLAVCGSPRTYCRTFGAADGWSLVAGSTYSVAITATYPDASVAVSAPSDAATARRVDVPPAIPAAQASACACEDALGRAAVAQQVRGFGVNTGTGAYSRTEADLSMASVGVPFAASRWYSSTSQKPGMFGVGWTWTYDMTVTASGDDAVVRAEDGAVATFEGSDDGTYRRPAGVRSNLRKTADGWTLTTPTHQVMTFDAQGRLLSVLDARGLGVRLTYGTDGLSTITDGAGRVVKISLRNDVGLIRRIELPDGRNVQFDYDRNRLISVQAPNGRTTQYRYDTAGRMSQVVDPRGAVQVATTYDATTGRVVKQVDVNGKETTFAWDASRNEATTTDADGVVLHDGYRNNHLVYTQNGNGDTHHVRYDATGNSNLSVDPNGNQRAATHDADGNATSSSAPEPFAFVEEAEYEGNEPTRFTDGNGKTWTAEYNSFHELTKKTDAEGHSTTYTYDDRGLRTTETDPRGKVTTFEYDEAGNRTAVVTPTGRRYVYTYDAVGRLTGTTDPRGTVDGADEDAFTTRYTYDESDRPATVSAPGKKTVRKSYDELGRLDVDTDPDGNSVRYSYDTANRLVEVKDRIGNVTAYTYTPAGRIASKTDAAGGRTTYTYNAKGLIATVVSPRGNVEGADGAAFTTTYHYDQNDNLLRTSRPAPGGGTVTQDASYDELDRTTSEVDENGVATSARFDNNSNLTSIIDPVRGVTRLGYDAADRQRSSTDPAGNTATVDYDAAGNVTRQVSATGAVTSFEYDDDARLVAVVDPLGNVEGADAEKYTTRFAYDGAGNRTTVTDPLGNVTTDLFDAHNRLVEHTDANGHTTSYTYDDLDRVRKVTAPDAKDGQGTSYTYDANGNATQVRDARGNAVTATYDRLGRIATTFDALGRLRQHTYDAESNLVETVTARTTPDPFNPVDPDRANRTITQTYDSLNRLTDRTLGTDGPTYTYGYDSKSRLTSAVSPSGTTTTTYDDADRITQVDREGRVYTYTYDVTGNLETQSNPDGTTRTASYDADDRITSLSAAGGTWGFTYDTAGRRATTTMPGDLVEKRSYDTAGRLTQVDSHGAGGTLARYDLTLDDGGRPTTIRTTRGEVSEDVAYTYDPANRLTAACYGTDSCAKPGKGKLSYEYDVVGNRTASSATGTAGASSETYRYDDVNALLSRTTSPAAGAPTTTTYGYDAEGNQTTAGSDVFEYHLDHSLASATVGGSTTTYEYDGLGNRVEATTDGVRLASDWDVNGELAQITSQRSGPVGGDLTGVRGLVHGPNDESLALLTSAGDVSALFVHDWLGGTSALVSPDGAVQSLADFDPYGLPRTSPTQDGLTVTPDPMAAENPVLYAGGYADPSLGGRYALRARDYDPTTGVFSTVDPAPAGLGMPLGSTYAYAAGSPTMYTDPAGEWPSLSSVWKSASSGVASAYRATATFVDKYQAEIVGVGVGIAAGAACGLTTLGAGSVACIAIGAAASSAATNLWRTKVQKKEEFTWGGLAKDLTIGTASSLVGYGLGRYVAKIPAVQTLVGRLANSTVGQAVNRVSAAVSTAVNRVAANVRTATVQAAGRARASTTAALQARGWKAMEPNATVRDLVGMRRPDVGGTAESTIKQLSAATRSNSALLRSVFRPKDGEHIALREGTTNVIDQGNHRVEELLRRAASSTSLRPDRITYDTPIYIRGFPGS
ncbi:DUF6531 domain-containing protein [Cellulomonas sp. KH9]|uniref:DUF6531 domain-containing protein n=1 Tax=Cellulomonas sp. KH9 TaxID=1855324 RepID=UPI0011604547|nr:DUF6531 domain-containing protein [Cellulomonas sp. KH9]